MTVIYRGLWQSRAENAPALEATREAISRWVTRDDAAASLADGEHVFGDRNIRIREISDENATAIEAVVSDHQNHQGTSTIWRTTVSTVVASGSCSTRVELEMETDQAVAREVVGRPRVVGSLLTLPSQPTYEGSSIWLVEREFGEDKVAELVDMLRDEARSLPFIVFSEPASWAVFDWRDAARRTALRVQGVANVVVLGQAAVSAFKSELDSLAVWGGGVRIYVPGPLDGAADGWRHRYVPARQMSESFSGAVDRIVFATCQLSTRRHTPAVFSILDRWTPPTSGTVGDFDQLQLELEIARDDLDESAAELSRVAGRYGRLVDALRQAGLERYVWEAHDQPDDDEQLPDVAQDMSDAVLNAQHYLSGTLFIPEEALADLDTLDTAPNRSAWGNTAWRGFRALSAYVKARRDGYEGGFWAWCERGEVDAWPATRKKLSMTESETVQNSEKLLAARLFPVDKRVDQSGRIHMLAHLKVAEGGGRLAPRIYFHDDTGGATKAIHVGFVGPHHLVPNSKA